MNKRMIVSIAAGMVALEASLPAYAQVNDNCSNATYPCLTAGNSNGGYGLEISNSTGPAINATTASSNSAVYAITGDNTFGNGGGVVGASSSSNGVLGDSQTGPGVHGNSTSGYGVSGISTSSNGVYGQAPGTSAPAIYGNATAEGGTGVSGTGNLAGMYGYTGGGAGSYGVYGYNAGTGGDGVYGVSGSGSGIYGTSTSGWGVVGTLGNAPVGSAGVYGDGGSQDGVYGTSSTGNGVVGVTSGSSNSGVAGINNGSGNGVYGASSSGYAGNFNGTVTMTSLYANGACRYGACSLSDERLKKNIKPLAGALDSLLQLKGVTFDWKDPEKQLGERDRGHQTGFIAQDVQKAFPTWVQENPDGFKTLDIPAKQVTALTVESIRELKAENDKLRARVDALEANRRPLSSGLTAEGSLFGIGFVTVTGAFVVSRRKRSASVVQE
jgi:hypothetical protein